MKIEKGSSYLHLTLNGNRFFNCSDDRNRLHRQNKCKFNYNAITAMTAPLVFLELCTRFFLSTSLHGMS